jgi:cytochrome c oxidase assembly protein subunit 15
MRRALLWIALGLAFAVIGTSSGLRLAADGLGCEPWPRCYGRTAGAPRLEVSPAERAARLGHRAAASAFAFAALAAVVLGWRRAGRGARMAGGLLIAVTAALAIVGPFTPSGLPALTLANVIGGLTLAGLVAYLLARPAANGAGATGRSGWIGALVLLVALQAASGASISVRQAGAACAEGCAATWPAGAHRLWHPLQPGTAVAVTRDARAGEMLHGVHRLLAILLVAAAAGAVARIPLGDRGSRGLPGALALCVLTGWVITESAGALGPVVLHALAAGALAVGTGAWLAAGGSRRSIE